MRTDRPGGTSRARMALLIATIVGACSASPAASPDTTLGVDADPPGSSGAAGSVAPSASQPAAAGSAMPAIAPGAHDAWLVVGRAGEPDVRVILASSREELFAVPAGVPDATWLRLVVTRPAETSTTVEDLVIQPGFGGQHQTIDGAWRLPTVGLDPMPVGVSADRSTIVLVEDAPARPWGEARTTRFAILSRPLGREPRFLELGGSFAFDALSPDGSLLYVAEHVEDRVTDRYQVRVVETATGAMRDTIIVDKRNIDEVMAGRPIDQDRRDDGVVLTLYRGSASPFIHALHSVEAWAVCIDLPTVGFDDVDAAADWGVATLPDGRASIAVNASLGLAVEIAPKELTIRRSITFEPSARRGVVLAKFGHTPPGVTGRRVVAAPAGDAILAAGERGIVRLATDTLAVTGRFLEGRAVDAIAVAPDGATLFALLRDGGRIVQLDAVSGEVMGWVDATGFDRLVGIVPW